MIFLYLHPTLNLQPHLITAYIAQGGAAPRAFLHLSAALCSLAGIRHCCWARGWRRCGVPCTAYAGASMADTPSHACSTACLCHAAVIPTLILRPCSPLPQVCKWWAGLQAPRRRGVRWGAPCIESAHGFCHKVLHCSARACGWAVGLGGIHVIYSSLRAGLQTPVLCCHLVANAAIRAIINHPGAATANVVIAQQLPAVFLAPQAANVLRVEYMPILAA